MTIFLGDIHGNITHLKSFLATMKDYEVIQLGDMGVGYPKDLGNNWPPKMDYAPDELVKLDITTDNFKWLRGNHDSPSLSRKDPNYLGEFGNYTTKDGFDIFFVSGAGSIPMDANREYPYITWWPDEELSIYQWEKCLDLYKSCMPNIVISHCCPQSITTHLHSKPLDPIGSLSERRMDEMLYIHRPKMWLFGHHHVNKEFVHQGTTFICVGIGSYRIYNPGAE